MCRCLVIARLFLPSSFINVYFHPLSSIAVTLYFSSPFLQRVTNNHRCSTSWAGRLRARDRPVVCWAWILSVCDSVLSISDRYFTQFATKPSLLTYFTNLVGLVLFFFMGMILTGRLAYLDAEPLSGVYGRAGVLTFACVISTFAFIISYMACYDLLPR